MLLFYRGFTNGRRSTSPSFQPLRIVERTVKIMRRFVEFILPALRSSCSLRQKGGHLFPAQGLEGAGNLQRLLQNRERIATGNDDAGRQVQGILQAFHRFGRLTPEDQAVAHGFHAQHAYVVFQKHRQYFFLETVVMSRIARWETQGRKYPASGSADTTSACKAMRRRAFALFGTPFLVSADHAFGNNLLATTVPAVVSRKRRRVSPLFTLLL
jgi:hypothetical protein